MKLKLNPFMVSFVSGVLLFGHCFGLAAKHAGLRASLAHQAPAQCPQDDPEAVAREVVGTYVEVQTGKGLGSGTVLWVGTEKLVLTAGHVVQGAETLKLYKELPDGRKL